MLQNYYRTLEEIRDDEFAEAQRARQEEDAQLHREHVRREHFEMQHRRREFAIVPQRKFGTSILLCAYGFLIIVPALEIIHSSQIQ